MTSLESPVESSLGKFYTECIDNVSLEKLLYFSKTFLCESDQMIYLLNHTVGAVAACRIKNLDLTLWALYHTQWEVDDNIEFTSKCEKVDPVYNIVYKIE